MAAKKLFLPVLHVAALASLITSSHAAIQTRDGDVGDNINLGAAWASGTAPGANDVARWSASSSLTNTLAANLNLLSIELLDTTGTVVIASDATMRTITLGGANLGSSGGGFPNNDATIDLSSTNATSLTIQTNLALLANSGQIWNVNTGRTFTHNTGTFTRNAGATLNIRTTGTGAVIAPNIAVDATGIIGPWATFGTGTAFSFATRNLTTNQIEAYTYTTANSTLDSLTSNVVNYQTGNTGAFVGANFNTLRYTGAAGTISGNYTANGILNGGTGILTLSGNATIGSTNELILSTPDGTRGIIISGTIADNGTNASKVIKAGDGAVTLSGANTYTGETVITRGILNVTHNNALGATGAGAGTTVYTAGGGFLRLGNSVTIAETLTFVGGDPTNLYPHMLGTTSGNNTITGSIILQSQLRVGTGGVGQTLNINGGVTGNGNQIVFNLASGTLNFNNTAINLGGGSMYSDQGGTVNINVGGNTWNGTTLGSGARMTIGLDNAMPSTTLTMGVNYGTAASTLELNGFNQSVTQLSQSSVNPGSITSSVERVGGGPATFTINQTSTTMYNGTFTGSLAVVKANTGRLRIGGASTHTGDTTVSAGNLEILQASAATINGVTLANGTNTINMSAFDVSGLSIGQSITGTGLDVNTFITAIDYTTKVVTLSRNTQAAAAGARDLTFAALTGSLASSTVNYTGGAIDFGRTTTSTSFGGLKGTQNLALTNSISGAVALTLGANNQNTVYTGVVSGNGSITKTGTGSTEFGGASTYTGNTIINQGTFLAANLTGSATGTGSVTVNNTAILGGIGSITGGTAQNINLGGSTQLMVGRTHGAAGTAQTFTLGNSTAVNNVGINVSGDILFDLYGAQNDQLKLFSTGTTDLTSATIFISSLDPSGWTSGQTWKLIDWAGTTGGSLLTSGITLGTTLLHNYQFTQSIQADGYYITATAVPEPSRAVLMLLGAAALTGLRRRRR